MRLGKTTIVHFTAQVVVSVSGFASTFAIAYFLGADGLGVYALVSALGFFWLVIPADAVGTAVAKRVSESGGETRYVSAGLALNGAFALAVAVALLAVGRALEATVATPDTEVGRVLVDLHEPMALLVVSAVLFKTGLSALKGTKRVDRQGLLQAVERVGRATLQVSVLVAGFGLVAVVVGHALSMLVVGVAAFVLVGLRMGRPTAEHVRSLLSFARYSWLGTVQSRVFGWMDTIVLGFFVSATLIGIYEAAWGLASLLAMVSSSIQQTLFPEVSELSTEDEYDRIHHYLNEGLVFSGVFVIPGFFGCLAIGQRVLKFYRPEFGRGAGILLILVAAYGADVYGSQFLNVLNAIDRPDVAFRINVAFVAVNLVANVGLVVAYGWYGAAVATASSTALRLALGYRQLSAVIGAPDVPVAELAKQGVAGAVMSVAVFVSRPYAPNNRTGTLLLVGLGAVTYVALLLALSVRVREKARGLVPAGSVPS